MELVIHSMTRAGAGSLLLELRASDGSVLPSCSPGSHIDLRIQGEKGCSLVRQYSLVNAGDPRPIAYLIAVARAPVSRGGSAAVHDLLRVGDSVEVSEPRNNFRLSPEGRSLLMAGGIGATPLVSMASSLAAGGREFELHVYGRTLAETPLLEYIEASKFCTGVITHTSDTSGSLRQATKLPWSYEPGDNLYMCGPAGFMDKVAVLAEDAGWPSGNVHRELFSAQKKEARNDSDSFTVIASSTGEEMTVAPDETIAEVLAGNGYHVELSCEQGICGSCMLAVLDGVPEHRDEVQSEEEHASNAFINVCCSRSASSSLTLEV